MIQINRRSVWHSAFVLASCFLATNLCAAQDEKDSLDSELQQHLLDQAGEDLGLSSSEPPLERVANKMREAEQLIRQTGSGIDQNENTRRVQENIVSTLDELIQQLTRKTSQPSQSSKSSNSKKQQQAKQKSKQNSNAPPSASSGDPKNRSADSNPTNQIADRNSAQSFLQELWGHLPQRTRQQVSQEWGEEFLPKYELSLEEYFRRLAEESARNSP